jgi:hypothetical protein
MGADLLVIGPQYRGALEAPVHPRISDAVAHTRSAFRAIRREAGQGAAPYRESTTRTSPSKSRRSGAMVADVVGTVA